MIELGPVSGIQRIDYAKSGFRKRFALAPDDCRSCSELEHELRHAPKLASLDNKPELLLLSGTRWTCIS